MVGGTILACGVVGLVDDRGLVRPAIVIAVGVLMVGNAAQMILRWPTRIIVGDDGLLFRALIYVRLVSWTDIESVRVSHGRYGGGIRWTLTQRPRITPAATFEDLHRLLVEVEHRAPQALVSP